MRRHSKSREGIGSRASAAAAATAAAAAVLSTSFKIGAEVAAGFVAECCFDLGERFLRAFGQEAACRCARNSSSVRNRVPTRR